MATWRDAIMKDREAREGYLGRLDRLIEGYQHDIDVATTWEAVLEARGAKKLLAVLRADVTLDARQEAAHARVFGSGNQRTPPVAHVATP